MNEQAKAQITRLVCYGWTEVLADYYTICFRKRDWLCAVNTGGFTSFIRD